MCHGLKQDSVQERCQGARQGIPACARTLRIQVPRLQDETEAEKAARRAAKKDKKDAKRARKDSQEPSQMPPG